MHRLSIVLLRHRMQVHRQSLPPKAESHLISSMDDHIWRPTDQGHMFMKASIKCPPCRSKIRSNTNPPQADRTSIRRHRILASAYCVYYFVHRFVNEYTLRRTVSQLRSLWARGKRGPFVVVVTSSHRASIALFWEQCSATWSTVQTMQARATYLATIVYKCTSVYFLLQNLDSGFSSAVC